MPLYRLFISTLLAAGMLLAAAVAIAQPGVRYFTKDSLHQTIDGKTWRFKGIDVPNGADTTLDDSTWPLVASTLPLANDDVAKGFNGIAWLRLHFILDSSAVAYPLAIRLHQYGASEVFLDGRKVDVNGVLLPKDSAYYINPQRTPVVLPRLQAGKHVLAVRYAAWDYKGIARWHNVYTPGFELELWTANVAITSNQNNVSSGLFAFVLLFGIFITLAVVHLILYLYYRADKANARFSVFAVCLALAFLFPAMIRVSYDARFILKLTYAGILDIAAIAFSLSYLLNSLFSKRRWHFYIVIAACFSVVVSMLLFREHAPIAVITVIVIVTFEALYILVSALIQKQPGARIIGGGLMLLILLLLTVLITVLIYGDVDFSNAGILEEIFVTLLVLAILSIPISMSMYLAWRFAHVNQDLKQRLIEVETLSARTREHEAEKQRMLEARKEELEHQVAERTASLRMEKEKSESLLHNILPVEVAEELKHTGKAEAKLYNNVTVLFTDFVDFTQRAEHLSPAQLVEEIDRSFKAFDDIIEQYGLEKIKTVGDAYIAVSGLPAENPEHAGAVVKAALAIRDYLDRQRPENPETFQIRIGIHSGPVVAGIVGVKKFAYDIWGDTVNTAARMEQHGEAGRINISTATYELVRDRFRCTFRGELEAKHKGRLGMYFVEHAGALT